MWKSVKFIFLVLFLISNYCYCSETENTNKDCLADYLKKNGILDSSFQSQPYTNSTELCDQFVIKLVSDFNSDLSRRIDNENLMDHKTCIEENFDKFGIMKLYLKAVVFNLFGRINNFKRKSAVTTNKLIMILDRLCDVDIYGKEFDLIRGSESIVSNENISCIQKTYFEANILNATDFNVDVSKINAENCSADDFRDFPIPSVIDPHYFGLPSNKVKKCYKKYFTKNQVSLRMATSVVFKNVDLSASQVESIRKKYNLWMTENQNAIFSCINKHL
ncbi:hypothetical protein PVAND_007833 [Polypedilum vanderplanki]|uniref:Uncharacterized protein n=1 Tax=Polypedilum vanderplanki TaxID=319348 RepID=A0A9J6C844_POLVA|nr:hypothetical protein PVAND_007833 [Polypedilum vanderplanki]